MMDAPTHEGDVKPCVVMTNVSISTVVLGEQGAFACLAYSRPDLDTGAIVILDEDDLQSQMILLQNAIDDAGRYNRGEPMIHTSPSGSTH